jgi:hypothetical protein
MSFDGWSPRVEIRTFDVALYNTYVEPMDKRKEVALLGKRYYVTELSYQRDDWRGAWMYLIVLTELIGVGG